MTKGYSTNIDVRFSDLDAYGHVNSAVYFTYLESARVKVFSDYFKEAADRGVFIVVARAECDYKTPILLYDPVVVTVNIARVGSSSFVLEYRLHDGRDTVYGSARTTMVCFDNVKKVTVAVPDAIKAMA